MTRDMIIQWKDVQPGDEVLIHSRLDTVISVHSYEQPWDEGRTYLRTDVVIMRRGRRVMSEQKGNLLAGVRRQVRESGSL
jgi:hypothetical protein